MDIPSEMVPKVLGEALRGMARLQARQEMLECVVRALIVEAPPVHPLFWKALSTAKSDLEDRTAQTNRQTPPEIDADALALWNALRAACAPPASNDNARPES
jgi:hypothetical protein